MPVEGSGKLGFLVWENGDIWRVKNKHIIVLFLNCFFAQVPLLAIARVFLGVLLGVVLRLSFTRFFGVGLGLGLGLASGFALVSFGVFSCIGEWFFSVLLGVMLCLSFTGIFLCLLGLGLVLGFALVASRHLDC